MKLKQPYQQFIRGNEGEYTYIHEDDIGKILYYKDKIKFYKWMFGQGIGVGDDGKSQYYLCDVRMFIHSQEVWTTAIGTRIEYDDLPDDHLQNILKDGYRNKNLLKQAKKRGMLVPTMATVKDYAKFLKSLLLCSAGNMYAQELIEMEQAHKSFFWTQVNRNKNKDFYV